MRKQLAVLFVLGTAGAACLSIDTIDHQVPPDAAEDAGVDSGSGSGSAMAGEMDPSPRDFDLELVVLGASLVVAIIPVPEIRRRRALNDAIETKPHFS
jgi:hypothetical protein